MKLRNNTEYEISIPEIDSTMDRTIGAGETMELVETDKVLKSYASGAIHKLILSGDLVVVEFPRVEIQDVTVVSSQLEALMAVVEDLIARVEALEGGS